MDDPHVLVIGTSCLDIKGQAAQPLQGGTSVPGTIHSSAGGVARNIAENLARLGVSTTLLSAVGDDRTGQRILAQAADAGIDVSQLLLVPATDTAAYLALFDHEGRLVFGLDDTRITAAIRPRYIYDNRRLFRDASMVVLDASPHAETLETIFRLAGRYQVPVCADPTSVTLASRLRPYLRDLLLVAPNVQEAEVLCRCPIPPGDHGAALAAAKTLVLRGVQIAIITMAEEGLCYATSEESGSVPAVQTEVVDLTGGGDALTAAVVFALLNEIPVSEAMQLGCSAASLTIACDQTTVPNLTLELLYDHLSV
jgi:pseudouridine kinase